MTNPTAPAVIVRPKSYKRSRTLWLNLISLMLIALEAKFSLLQPYLPGNVYAWFVVFLAVANPALRLITTAPLTFGKGEQ